MILSLDKSVGRVYIPYGCARRGVSGSLVPKSAYAGLNSLFRVFLESYGFARSDATQQTLTNLVRSGRKQR